MLREKKDDPVTVAYLSDPDNLRQLLLSSHEQNRMIDVVRSGLESSGFSTTVVYRGDLNSKLICDSDCVFSLGGDGTVLEVNAYNKNTPVVGVNTDKRMVELNQFDGSEGFYCAMSQLDFDAVFSKFLEGDLDIVDLMRLEVEVDGKLVMNPRNGLVHRVLNDISITGRSGHSTADYSVILPGYCEQHRSSGVIISTPQSSWSYWEMGGVDLEEVLSVEDCAFNVVARGLGPRQSHVGIKTRRFIVRDAEYVEVKSKNPRTSLAIDGDHPDTVHELGLDRQIKVYRSAHPLPVVGFDTQKIYWYASKANQPVTREF